MEDNVTVEVNALENVVKEKNEQIEILTQENKSLQDSLAKEGTDLKLKIEEMQEYADASDKAIEELKKTLENSGDEKLKVENQNLTKKVKILENRNKRLKQAGRPRGFSA